MRYTNPRLLYLLYFTLWVTESFHENRGVGTLDVNNWRCKNCVPWHFDHWLLVRRLGLSSAPETLQFRPQPFGTVCQQLWDGLSSCSVQTFAQKLKTFYASATMERIGGTFILRFTNSLIIIIIFLNRCRWYWARSVNASWLSCLALHDADTEAICWRRDCDSFNQTDHYADSSTE